jgi:hypothetical protein
MTNEVLGFLLGTEPETIWKPITWKRSAVILFDQHPESTALHFAGPAHDVTPMAQKSANVPGS